MLENGDRVGLDRLRLCGGNIRCEKLFGKTKILCRKLVVFFSRNTHVHAGDNKLIINGSINCYLILNPTGLYGDSL